MKIVTPLLATAPLLGLSSYGIFANAQDLPFPQLASLEDVSFDVEDSETKRSRRLARHLSARDPETPPASRIIEYAGTLAQYEISRNDFPITPQDFHPLIETVNTISTGFTTVLEFMCDGLSDIFDNVIEDLIKFIKYILSSVESLLALTKDNVEATCSSLLNLAADVTDPPTSSPTNSPTNSPTTSTPGTRSLRRLEGADAAIIPNPFKIFDTIASLFSKEAQKRILGTICEILLTVAAEYKDSVANNAFPVSGAPIGPETVQNILKIIVSYVIQGVNEFVTNIEEAYKFTCEEDNAHSLLNIAKQFSAGVNTTLDDIVTNGLNEETIYRGRKNICTPIAKSYRQGKIVQKRVDYLKDSVDAFQKKGGIECAGGVEILGGAEVCALVATALKEGGYVAEFVTTNVKKVVDTYIATENQTLYTDLCTCFKEDNLFLQGSGCDGIDQDCDGESDNCEEDQYPPDISLPVAIPSDPFQSDEEAVAFLHENIVTTDDCAISLNKTIELVQTEGITNTYAYSATDARCPNNTRTENFTIQVDDQPPSIRCGFYTPQNPAHDQQFDDNDKILRFPDQDEILVVDPNFFYNNLIEVKYFYKITDNSDGLVDVTVEVQSNELEQDGSRMGWIFLKKRGKVLVAGASLEIENCNRNANNNCIFEERVSRRFFDIVVSAKDSSGNSIEKTCTIASLDKTFLGGNSTTYQSNYEAIKDEYLMSSERFVIDSKTFTIDLEDPIASEPTIEQPTSALFPKSIKGIFGKMLQEDGEN